MRRESYHMTHYEILEQLGAPSSQHHFENPKYLNEKTYIKKDLQIAAFPRYSLHYSSYNK